ncbi:MAG: hypothetical protein CSA32_00990 [Desulfobulbus propionicus]|nr:MAG: hypothetical protein CSA32_00990 [Desulfobulbus propionicus]
MVEAHTLRKKRQQKKRWLVALFVVALLISGSLYYFRLPFPLQKEGEMLAAVLGKVTQTSADNLSADAVLRGSVYDRSFNELAVSYWLYSLIVQPMDITDRNATADKLAEILGGDREQVMQYLESRQKIVHVADNLDQTQASVIRAAQLSGVYCEYKEVRFYPGHSSAAHTIGYVNEGVGLAGIEGRYDTVLQPGEFQQEDIEVIDFQEEEILGKESTDLILTVDLQLQKELEQKLQLYMKQLDAATGAGALIETATGKILALVNYPAYNPNYFWQAEEKTREEVFYRHRFRRELISPLLIEAAAIQGEGLGLKNLLPATIAAPDYGVDAADLAVFEHKIHLRSPVPSPLQEQSPPAADEKTSEQADREQLTLAQLSTTVACLINGGWRITPYLLESMYDHATRTMYTRKENSVQREHVLEPAEGIVLRRHLLRETGKEKGANIFSVHSACSDVEVKKGVSHYIQEELYLGLTTGARPRYLLMIAVEKKRLEPMPFRKNMNKIKAASCLDAIGESLLSQAEQLTPSEPRTFSDQKSKDNLSRFFISKRLGQRRQPEQFAGSVANMPRVTGLSLRKALQRLNQFEVNVRIKGSGAIVSQVPAPGTEMNGIRECLLTLKTNM